MNHNLKECSPDGNPVWKTYQPVYLRRRLWAAILDHLLAIPLAQLLLLGFTVAIPSLSAGYQLLLLQLLYPAYFFLMAGLFSTSVGKWIFKMRIVHATTGLPLSWRQAWSREVAGRLLNAFLFPVGLITVVRPHSRAQTIADEIGNTVVVTRRKSRSDPK